MRVIGFELLIGLVSLACAAKTQPSDDACLFFSVLDTRVEEAIVYDFGPVPVLEVLPIRQSDILSATYRREPRRASAPKQFDGAGQTHLEDVEVVLSPSAAAVLTEAATKHRLKKLRISRKPFESLEVLMMAAPANNGIAISVATEHVGRELVAMLTLPCEEASAP